jgi:hypothetical protein
MIKGKTRARSFRANIHPAVRETRFHVRYALLPQEGAISVQWSSWLRANEEMTADVSRPIYDFRNILSLCIMESGMLNVSGVTAVVEFSTTSSRIGTSYATRGGLHGQR